MVNRVSIKAVLLGGAYGYLLPAILFQILARGALWLDVKALSSAFAMLAFVWFFLFAPLVTGYVAAKNSSSFPIYHGLAAVSISLLGLLIENESPRVMIAIVVIMSLILGVVGARRYKLSGA